LALDPGFDVTQIPFTINGLEKGNIYNITITAINEFDVTINGPYIVDLPDFAIFLPLTTKN
jgi:hypothetical protein